MNVNSVHYLLKAFLVWLMDRYPLRHTSSVFTGSHTLHRKFGYPIYHCVLLVVPVKRADTSDLKSSALSVSWPKTRSSNQ